MTTVLVLALTVVLLLVVIPTRASADPPGWKYRIPPYPSGSGWTKPYVQNILQGYGGLSTNTYLSSPVATPSNGELTVQQRSMSGTILPTVTAYAYLETQLGFNIGMGTFTGGTHSITFEYSITAQIALVPAGELSHACANITLQANLWDSSAGKWVYSSPATYFAYKWCINYGWYDTLSDQPEGLSISPSLTAGHSYNFYFFLDITTSAWCLGDYCQPASMVNMATSGNAGYSDWIEYK
ncbi:MAG TPA: hypothetical protein VEH28_00525 [Thermoplasmata archaeon]|nr:hypothetical protein [Thermoplasmata archaeon]